MPIWLRNFTFNKIKKYYDDEREAKMPKTFENKKPEIARPNIPQAQPTYSTKIPKSS